MKILRKSWFGNLNYFFLQFFFIRLQKCVHSFNDGITVPWTSWELIGFIVPCTGWSTDYIYVFRGWKLEVKRGK